MTALRDVAQLRSLRLTEGKSGAVANHSPERLELVN